jgi:hypothetical protein
MAEHSKQKAGNACRPCLVSMGDTSVVRNQDLGECDTHQPFALTALPGNNAQGP